MTPIALVTAALQFATSLLGFRSKKLDRNNQPDMIANQNALNDQKLRDKVNADVTDPEKIRKDCA